MGLSKQAKIPTDKQLNGVMNYLTTTRYPVRNQVMFLLSYKSGLRAKEIGGLKWMDVLNTDLEVSDSIQLRNSISKGKSGGRIIPMNKELKVKLTELYAELKAKRWFDPEIHSVILSERKKEMSSKVVRNFFQSVYDDMGLVGCSSHSGRRSAISKLARTINLHGGSLRDVQAFAGHSSIATTERYIDTNSNAQIDAINSL